jgi:cell division protein FtsB
MNIESKDRNLMLAIVLFVLVAVFFIGTILKVAHIDGKIAAYTANYESLCCAAEEKQQAADALSLQYEEKKQQWEPYVVLYEKWVGWNEEILQYINP